MKLGDVVDTITEAKEIIRAISSELDKGMDYQVGDLISLSDVNSTMRTLVEFISESNIN